MVVQESKTQGEFEPPQQYRRPNDRYDDERRNWQGTVDQKFVDSLTTYADLLSSLLRWLPEEPAETTRSLRQLADELRRSATSGTFPELQVAAASLASAADDSVEAVAHGLLAVLQARVSSGVEVAPPIILASPDVDLRSELIDALEDVGRTFIEVGNRDQLSDALAIPSVGLVLVHLDPALAGLEEIWSVRTATGHDAAPLVVLARSDGPSRGQLMAHGADHAFVIPDELPAVAIGVEGLLRRFGRARAALAADALTGLPTRAAFEASFAQAVGLARRSGAQLSVALLDFDHFKSVNDNYGHVAGDEVLRRCSRVIRSRLRDSDVLVRWGGEELAVVFPATNPTEAKRALEDALQQVSAELFHSLQTMQVASSEISSLDCERCADTPLVGGTNIYVAYRNPTCSEAR